MDRNFRDILRKVPRSYSDFVISLDEDLKPDEKKLVIDFIKKNPEARSDDVLGYVTDEIWKIPDVR